MRHILFFFVFVGLASSCVSTQPDYDSVQKTSRLKQSERNIAYLKNISKVEDNNYDFISSQMQTLIRNYKRMRKHLSGIEDKLDSTLKKLESYKYKSLLEAKSKELSPKVEDEIRIKNQENEEVILTINHLDDYKYIMGELVAGDYNTSEQETQRALTVLKQKLAKSTAQLSRIKKQTKPLVKKQTKPLVKKSAKPLVKKSEQFIDAEEEANASIDDEEARNTSIDATGTEKESDKELFDEDSLLNEELTGEVDLFSQESGVEFEKNNASFLLGKKFFKNKSYEMAVAEFQKYRNENPNGKHYLEATFYMGQAFEKLKMPVEANIFFQEIVKTSSDTLWAMKAKKEIEK